MLLPPGITSRSDDIISIWILLDSGVVIILLLPNSIRDAYVAASQCARANVLDTLITSNLITHRPIQSNTVNRLKCNYNNLRESI